jgi:hypothetical protein
MTPTHAQQAAHSRGEAQPFHWRRTVDLLKLYAHLLQTHWQMYTYVVSPNLQPMQAHIIHS